jgi:hypothetical protein
MKIRYISFSIQLIGLAVSSGLSVADSASNTVDSNAGRIYNINLFFAATLAILPIS